MTRSHTLAGAPSAPSALDNVLGTVEIHSTGSGPEVLIDDRASTTGRLWTIGPNGSAYTITGFGTGRLSLIGFKPADVYLLGGMGDDTFKMMGRIPGLYIDGGGGINTLDYSSYITAVIVNLAAGMSLDPVHRIFLVTGTATDIDLGICRIGRVIFPKH